MTLPGEDLPALNELDSEEFRERTRSLAPDMTDEKFAEKWAEFVKLKQQKKLN